LSRCDLGVVWDQVRNYWQSISKSADQRCRWLPGFNFNVEEWDAEGLHYETLAICRSLALARAALAAAEKPAGRFLIRSRTQGGTLRGQPAIVSKAGKFNLWWSKDLPHYTLPEALTATG
jgi:hypothetical protein